jgi:hypothetical protein
MTGAELIAAERQRQIDVEGYSAQHDIFSEPDGQLAVAAWCYLGDLIDDGGCDHAEEPGEWPWPHYGDVAGCSWKPTPDNPIRQLTKAGALVAAEIDRLLAAKEEA